MVQVGVARVQLEAVRWLLDVDEQTPLVDYRGARNGDLAVCLVPSLVLPGRRRRRRSRSMEEAEAVRASGDGHRGTAVIHAKDEEIEHFEMEEDDYEDLADAPPGSGLALMVHLKHATGLPQRLVAPARSLYVSFRFPSAFLLDSNGGSSSGIAARSSRSSSSKCSSGDSSSRRSEVIRSARVPLPGGHERLCAPIEWSHTLELAVTPALVDFAATAALVLEVWLSVDPPGPWNTATTRNADGRRPMDEYGSDNHRTRHHHRVDGDYDSEDSGEEGHGGYYRDSLSDGSGRGFDSEESGSDSDEGLPPHGIAVMRNQPTALQQRRRERQWQRQRQGNEQQGVDEKSHDPASSSGKRGSRGSASSSPPHSPSRNAITNFADRTSEQQHQQSQSQGGPTAAEYAAVVAEAEHLRAENASLSAQLEDALKLIATMQDAEAQRNREAAASNDSADINRRSSGSSGSSNDRPSCNSEGAPVGNSAVALALPNPAPLSVAGKSARSRSRERAAAAAARLRLGDAQTLDREFNGTPSSDLPAE